MVACYNGFMNFLKSIKPFELISAMVDKAKEKVRGDVVRPVLT
jgi:hypothetical protein